MSIKEFDVLFEEIKNVTGLVDVGYHEIRDGRLNPVYKTGTDTLGLKKWKSIHAQNPVFIKDTEILRQIVGNCQSVAVNDVKTDTRSADAFFLFGLDSILVVPVVVGGFITGIYCIGSIGKPHNFSEEEVSKCEELINSSKLKIPYGKDVNL